VGFGPVILLQLEQGRLLGFDAGRSCARGRCSTSRHKWRLPSISMNFRKFRKLLANPAADAVVNKKPIV
jgi:hypothetical protein